MILACHQPNFLPYAGFFNKLNSSDIFVIHDLAQFVKREFNNRNKIKTREGSSWLTVPVSRDYQDPINEVRLVEGDWKQRHFNLLEENYFRAPHYEKYIEKIKEIYSKDLTKLVNLNLDLIEFVSNELEINTPTILSSEMKVEGKSTAALVNMCLEAGANTYLSGTGGRNYLDESKFEKNGIKLIYQDFEPPQYRQQFGDFKPYMSIIDLLFNEGEKSRDILFKRGK